MGKRAKLALVGATYVAWPLIIGLGIYFPFFRSPEMTNSQLAVHRRQVQPQG